MGEGPVTAAIISAHEIVHTGLEGMFATRPGAVEVMVLDPGAPDDQQPDVILYDVFGLHDGEGEDLDRFVKDYHSAVIAMARDLRPDLAARALAKGVAPRWRVRASRTPRAPVPSSRARTPCLARRSGSPRARPTSCAC